MLPDDLSSNANNLLNGNKSLSQGHGRTITGIIVVSPRLCFLIAYDTSLAYYYSE